MSHRAAGSEPPLLPPAHARGMVSEASVAHFGYLSVTQSPPARLPVRPTARPRGGGAAGPGRSRSLCNQCSPDLIPGRTHPTGSRGPGRDNSQRREPRTRAPAGHFWLAKAGNTAREFEKQCQVPLLAGKVAAGVRGSAEVSRKNREIGTVTPRKAENSDKDEKKREQRGMGRNREKLGPGGIKAQKQTGDTEMNNN